MMDWPPQTPHLNPAKQIWSKFEKEVRKFLSDIKYTFDWGVEGMEENLYIREDTL